MTRLHDLFTTGGQSPWIDNLTRGGIRDGELAALVARGIRGVTSNPTIFQKAMSAGDAYDEQFARLLDDRSVEDAYWEMVVADISAALDVLRPVYDTSGGADGFVSVEVSPALAADTAATVAAARELHERIAQPNLMVKIPGTRAGLPAIRALLAQGLNVNVTLLFGLARYRAVVEAFLAALEDRRASGRPLDAVASVASFFLSRIDTLVDGRLERDGRPGAAALRGRAAIACARLAYFYYKEWTAGPRWRALAAAGARTQRLLWASTSTKNPAYDDVKYVEALIGADTVTTLPLETVRAYRDHGDPAARLQDDLAAARALPEQLAALGIDLEAVSGELERQGVRKFVEPYDRTLAAFAPRARHAGPEG